MYRSHPFYVYQINSTQIPFVPTIFRVAELQVDTITFLPAPDAPGAPSAPVVSDVFSDSCVLTWSPPDFDGGAPITGYYVERSTNRAGRWIRITREAVTEKCSHKVTELIQDNEYQFRVIAINKVGPGPAGPASETIVAKDPWGEFTSVFIRIYYFECMCLYLYMYACACVYTCRYTYMQML